MKGGFGETLRKCRQEARLYLKDVANKMGWSVVYLSDLERERRNPPSPDKIRKLAEILGVPAGILLEAASRTRKVVELPLEEDSRASEVALMLARSWDGLTDEDAEEIKKILERRKG